MANQKPLIVFVRLFAFVFIIASTTISEHYRPSDTDFSQFYMGGLVARSGEWNALYPVPKSDSVHNPGLSRDSDLKPRTAALAAGAKVPRTEFHFIQLPVSALLLAPLSLLSYHHALWIWILLAGGFSAMTAILAGDIFGLLSGDNGWKHAAVIFVVTISQFIYRSVRVTNASAFIGFCIAWAAYEIIREQREQPSSPTRSPQRSQWRAAIPVVIGGIFKYATFIFVPILIAQRSWRTLIAVVGTVVVLLPLSMIVTGASVYREFYSTIMPRLDRPSAEADNQCVQGAVLRVIGKEPPLPASAKLGVTIARYALLATILTGLFTRISNADSTYRPATFAAASAAMTAWLLLFSPISWDHNYVYTCGFWGWLAFEAGTTRLRQILVIAIVPLWLVDSIDRLGLIPKMHWPYGEHLQLGLVLMLIVGLLRLYGRKNISFAQPMPLSGVQPQSLADHAAVARGVTE